MSDKQKTHQEPIIDADTVEETQDSSASAKEDAPSQGNPKKKSNLKFYFVLILALVAGTWAFWTFSPEAKQLRLKFQTTFTQPTPEITAQPKPVPQRQTTQPNESSTKPNIAVPTTAITTTHQEPSPLFEADTQAPTPETSTPQAQTQATPSVEPNTPEVTAAIQTLQQQVDDLTQAIGSLQHQQQQWSQQQVRAQLFALLRQASSPQSNLDTMMIAWKSISFLPLLSQDKRDAAEQAATDLQETQQRITQAEIHIQSLINTLASQMNPKAIQDVTQDIGQTIDTPQQSDAFDSWLDWLKQQFVITKLDKHALELSDDPYAELKQLITELHQLKISIHQHNWGNIGSLKALLYQLEQRGLEAEFSHESIANLQADIRYWQDEAQTWMAQL
ncbi:MAG: hypothetical protein Q9N02_11125 [Ghiorsea sp.]|nr:hypothetical protein [Ghiorsea sp.]